MKWNKKQIQTLNWNGEISNLEQKEHIALKIAKKIQNDEVIGFGSGSTSFLAAKAIAKRMQEENIQITAIPTSREIELLCTDLKIPTTTLIQTKPDWCFDGADEINEKKWLVKGRGGAMFREKLNIANANITYILVDESKFVQNLCDNFPIPIEIFPVAINAVRKALQDLGANQMTMRLAKGKDGPVITENGNLILDVVFTKVEEELEKRIKQIPGVIESGLFIGYPIEVMRV